MSVILTFTGSGFTAAKYDEAIKLLETAGAGAPKGRKYHVSYGDPENLHITDIWEDMAGFQAFGQTLVPILQSLGLGNDQPAIQDVYNEIVG